MAFIFLLAVLIYLGLVLEFLCKNEKTFSIINNERSVISVGQIFVADSTADSLQSSVIARISTLVVTNFVKA